MNKILGTLIILILVNLFAGLSIALWDSSVGNKMIGFSVLGFSFLFLPLFLQHRWKGKRLKDYTLTQEKMNKMKSFGQRKNKRNKR